MVGSRLQVWSVAGLLALLTIALYWPVTGYDFVNYDDDFYVTANAQVQSGVTWEGTKWACLNPVADNWHPLTVWSHMLLCQFCGLNPWGHHLANVVLHGLNAALVFALLSLMTGATGRSLLVAALFAIHPLRVESVAWVSERKDVLSVFFGLLSLIAYARYAQARMQNAECRMQDPATRDTQHPTASTFHVSRFTFHTCAFYLLSFLFFALGLMSKPMLVTLPFVLLLLDYWPLGRMQNAEAADTQHATRNKDHASRFTFHVSLLVEKLPFFALAAATSVVTFVVQQRGASLTAAGSLPLGTRVGNALISYCRHLGKLFWPTDLAVFYPHPGQWPLGKVLLSSGLILGISVLVWGQRRRYPYLLVGWLWFVGMLVPVIGLVQTGSQALADRHTYLPALGMLVVMIWGAYELTRRWRYHMLALSVVSGTAIVLSLAMTRRQIDYWRDSETLFQHALEVTENNQLAHYNLGVALEKKGQVDEAIRQYQETIRLKPDYVEARNNLGAALLKRGQVDEAIRLFQETARREPANAYTHNNLGIALCKKGQMDEAINQFQEAIRLKPDYAMAHYNLGSVLAMKGRTDAAINQFQEAIRLKPDSAEAHYGLSVAFANKGQVHEANDYYQEALRLTPGHARAPQKLGSPWTESPTALGAQASTLDAQGKYAEAIRLYQAALKAQPDQEVVQNNLAWLLATCPDAGFRDGPEAVRLATRACELTSYAKPLLIGTLAAAQAEAGDFQAAIATGERAAALADTLRLEEVAAKNRELIQLYRQGQAFHEKR